MSNITRDIIILKSKSNLIWIPFQKQLIFWNMEVICYWNASAIRNLRTFGSASQCSHLTSATCHWPSSPRSSVNFISYEMCDKIYDTAKCKIQSFTLFLNAWNSKTSPFADVTEVYINERNIVVSLKIVHNILWFTDKCLQRT